MRHIVQTLVLLLLGLIAGGLVVPSVSRVRDAANRMGCQNNLKQIGMALQSHDDSYGHFPIGTVPDASLPPDRRLSWAIQLWPTFMNGGTQSLLDKSKAWDAEENCPPRWRVCLDKNTGRMREELMSEVRVFLCPANPARCEPQLPSPTHYLGVAGLGEAAAELPLSDPRAGFFGYDRQLRREDVKDGLATTLAVAEAVDGGPWTAGGRATLRGLAVGDLPYLGEGSQFASHHGGKFFPWSLPVVTNVLLADGCVRPLTDSLAPQVFEALATVAGGEKVGAIGNGW